MECINIVVAKVTLGANRTLGAGTGGVAGSFFHFTCDTRWHRIKNT